MTVKYKVVLEPRRATHCAYFNRSELWHVAFNRSLISVAEDIAIKDWLAENARGWFDISSLRVAFEDQTDAKLFFLAFA